MASIYDFTVKNADGSDFSLKDYEGKVVIIVNTATGCGFTPQYEDLEKLYESYHDKGLEILDIPCNQFAGQAPGSDEEIHSFCTLHYHTSFPQRKKSDVNGANELPLYTYLKTQQKFKGLGKGLKAKMVDMAYKSKGKVSDNPDDIHWNFTKFLVDRQGNVVARYEPTQSMKDFEEAVKTLMEAK